ncbi:MAG: hypothetical protein ACRDI2_03340, partial [Chloroflexota bacterium]
FLVSWPGHFPEGAARDGFVTGCDLLPTLIPLASRGARWTHGEPRPFIPWPGADLAPLLRDAGAPWRDRIMGEFSSGRTFKGMLRWDDAGGSWRYAYYANGGREQLFNLATDPDELRDLAHAEPERCHAARRRLVEQYRRGGYHPALDETGDHLLAFPFERLPLGDINNQSAVWPQHEP